MYRNAIILFLASTLSAQALLVSVVNTNLAWDSQPGWQFDNGDFPAGSYIGFVEIGQTVITAQVTLPETVAAGTYQAWFNLIRYTQTPTPYLVVNPGNTTNISNVVHIDDNNFNKRWTTGAVFTASSAFSTVKCTFVKLQIADRKKFNVTDFVLTDDLSVTMNKDGIIANVNTQTPAQANHRDPTAGNLLHNSSFEVGHEAWGRSANGVRTNYATDGLTTDQAYDGNWSLSMVATQTPDKVFAYGYAGRVQTNMTHTLSVWTRGAAGATNTHILRMRSITESWDGFPVNEIYSTGKSISDTNWTRLVLTMTNLTQYPSPYYYWELEAQSFGSTNVAGNPIVYWDALQFEQGTQATTYAQRKSIEIGITNAKPGGIFHDTDTLLVYVNQKSTITNNIYTNMHFEIYNGFNSLVSTGCVYLALTGSVYRSDPWGLPTNGLGHFRCHYWLGEDPNVSIGQQEEFSYSVVKVKRFATLDTNALLGTQGAPLDYATDLTETLGIGFGRALSPLSAVGRWTTVETADHTYEFADIEVGRTVTQQVLMGTIHLTSAKASGSSVGQPDHVPDVKSFMLSSTTGVFQVGEDILGPGGVTGEVTFVRNDGEPMLDGTNGTFIQIDADNAIANGAVITGVTSAAEGTVDESNYIAINMARWIRYVTNVVHHYGPNGTDTIGYWETGNEHKGGELFWTNDSDPDAFLAQWFKETEQAIRDADTNAFVIGGGGWNGVTQSSNVVTIINNSDGYSIANFDAWSMHNYPVGEDDGAEGPFSFSLVKSNFVDKLLGPNGVECWNTESGQFDHGGYLFNKSLHANLGTPYQAYVQGLWAYRGLGTGPIQMQRNLAQTLCWWSVSNRCVHMFYDTRQHHRIPNSDPWDVQNTAGFEWDDHVKPKLVAYSILGRFLDQSTSLGPLANSSTNLNGLLFSAATNTCVIWTKNDETMHLDGAADFSAGDIIVYDMWGNILSTNATGLQVGRNLKIIEANEITLATFQAGLTNVATAVADTNAPSLAVTEVPIGTVDGRLVDIRYIALDDQELPKSTNPEGIVYQHQLSPLEGSLSAYSGFVAYQYTDLVNGDYTLTVNAKDAAGNVSTATRTFTVAGGAEAAASSAVAIGERGTQWPLRSWLWDRMP